MPLTRRDLFRSAIAGAAFSIVPRQVLGGEAGPPPSERLAIAGIGIGGMGKTNLHALATAGHRITALCDVDLDYAAPVIKAYADAEVFTDYRVLLDKRKDIDAVVIATPDHTHAVIAAAAMRAGKHVYCQKPLCHDVRECRELARIAAATGVTTQMGIQGRSGEGHRLVREWIADGAVGEVLAVDAWCSLSYYPFGQAYWSPKWNRRPTDTPRPPPGLKDWDLWLGPAPERPYHPAYHPGAWRAWWDFGCGMMGDRGAHTLDTPVTALDLDLPESIDATSCGLNEDTHPLSAIVTYRFPAKGVRKAITLTWYEGTCPPRPDELEDGRDFPKEGGFLIKGTRGVLMAGVYGEGPRLLPEKRMKEYQRPAKSLPRVKGSHELEWAAACKAERKAVADFAYAAHLTEICLLGNVAKRANARIRYDGAAMKVLNHPEADRWLAPAYRAGWTL